MHIAGLGSRVRMYMGEHDKASGHHEPLWETILELPAQGRRRGRDDGPRSGWIRRPQQDAHGATCGYRARPASPVRVDRRTLRRRRLHASLLNSSPWVSPRVGKLTFGTRSRSDVSLARASRSQRRVCLVVQCTDPILEVLRQEGRPMLRFFCLVALLFSLALPARISAQTTDDCSTLAPTIAGLADCVQHALAMGHITSAGVAQSLLAKLDAAQAAVDRGQTQTAIRLLQAFVDEVKAQSGQSIIAEHATHLIQHAELVIQALQL